MVSSRREFIKRVGIMLAALASVRCRLPTGGSKSPRDRLRAVWRQLDWLAEETKSARQIEQGEKARDRLLQDHRSALDELVANGDLEAGVAEQVQTAFDAAVYHIWRSNAPITCYEAVMIDYKPATSDHLVAQAELLAESDGLDPDTVALAQSAIARDVAFLNLSDDEVNVLYEKLIKAAGEGYHFPPFDELELDISPEAAQAAQFLVELLLEE